MNSTLHACLVHFLEQHGRHLPISKSFHRSSKATSSLQCGCSLAVHMQPPHNHQGGCKINLPLLIGLNHSTGRPWPCRPTPAQVIAGALAYATLRSDQEISSSSDALRAGCWEGDAGWLHMASCQFACSPISLTQAALQHPPERSIPDATYRIIT